MALRQIWSTYRQSLSTPRFSPAFPRFFSNSTPYIVKRKLILKFAYKYRLGLWRPRAEPVKA